MKSSCLLLVLLVIILKPSISQVPNGINYQAIARGNDNKEIPNTNLLVKISVLTDTTGFYSSGGGTYLWEEQQNVTTTNIGLFSLTIGNPNAIKIQGSALSFSSIDWKVQPLFIGTKIYYQGNWEIMGSARLWSVPYSIIAQDLEGSIPNLEVVGNDVLSDEALFEVKRKDGQTMFAVYNHGVRINMPLDTLSKAKKGGFAIGGFDGAKGVVQEYFIVNPDSIRAYIDSNSSKARKGGFAIGGFDRAKAGNEEYLRVSQDSTRIYINDLATKGRKGGFAIGGFDKAKGGNSLYLNIETDTTGIINPAQNRILWYPLKNAFLTGKVLIQTPDSVGENSFSSGFESKAIGAYSQAMGFRAIAKGYGSTSSGAWTRAYGRYSYCTGSETSATGQNSTAMGLGSTSRGWGSLSAGIFSDAVANSSFAMGIGAVASGEQSAAIGDNPRVLGYSGIAIGQFVRSYSAFESVFGSSNTIYTPVSTENWKTNDRLFVVGCGNPEAGTRANALTILKSGRIGLQSVENPTYALQLPNSTNIGIGTGIAYSWITYSDSRIKQNQMPLRYGLKEIMRLSPKQYLHLSTNEDHSITIGSTTNSIGLIAQEVIEVIPEAVHRLENYDSELWGIDYDKLIPVLVRAIQEQEKTIENQKAEIENLKKLEEEINVIRNLLNNLLFDQKVPKKK